MQWLALQFRHDPKKTTPPLSDWLKAAWCSADTIFNWTFANGDIMVLDPKGAVAAVAPPGRH